MREVATSRKFLPHEGMHLGNIRENFVDFLHRMGMVM